MRSGLALDTLNRCQPCPTLRLLGAKGALDALDVVPVGTGHVSPNLVDGLFFATGLDLAAVIDHPAAFNLIGDGEKGSGWVLHVGLLLVEMNTRTLTRWPSMPGWQRWRNVWTLPCGLL